MSHSCAPPLFFTWYRTRYTPLTAPDESKSPPQRAHVVRSVSSGSIISSIISVGRKRRADSDFFPVGVAEPTHGDFQIEEVLYFTGTSRRAPSIISIEWIYCNATPRQQHWRKRKRWSNAPRLVFENKGIAAQNWLCGCFTQFCA